jgi:hypothetical protein
MWWDIIKETRLSSKQTSTLNWDEEMVSDEEEEGPCKKKVIALLKYLRTFNFNMGSDNGTRHHDEDTLVQGRKQSYVARYWIGIPFRYGNDSKDYFKLSMGVKGLDEISEEQCCYWLSKIKLVLSTFVTSKDISQKDIGEYSTGIGSRENVGDLSCYHSTHGASSNQDASTFNSASVYLRDLKGRPSPRFLTFNLGVKTENYADSLLSAIRDIERRL